MALRELPVPLPSTVVPVAVLHTYLLTTTYLLLCIVDVGGPSPRSKAGCFLYCLEGTGACGARCGLLLPLSLSLPSFMHKLCGVLGNAAASAAVVLAAAAAAAAAAAPHDE